MTHEPIKVGKKGTVVIPVELRRKFGLVEGTLAVAEPRDEGVLIRPVSTTLPAEMYSDARKASLLLSSAIDEKDYSWAVEQVRKMGLDPDA
ncbi:MAG: AbrB/MazE/SpoVT family DNA-binding domain-containing protein, partial [Deltaproteobacteria bacterium]|nr:AbrB/MazE/SpoVT family DNA-binding domain-containing protein [Deltaproteobacteria bacterium]